MIPNFGGVMRRREFLIGLAVGSAARPATAQSKSARIIGILYLGTETDATTLSAALRRGLMERGYAEERDFRLEIRFANNDASQLQALARDPLTHGTTSVRAALAETKRVPIALAGGADPAEQGIRGSSRSARRQCHRSLDS